MPDLYEQRERADAFGSVTEDYDRYRPNYPGELMDRCAALRAALLELGHDVPVEGGTYVVWARA